MNIIFRGYLIFLNEYAIYFSSEAKNAYFMIGEATNEKYFFSLHTIELMAYSFQKNEFSFYYIQI